jgi:hypothetical protein
MPPDRIFELRTYYSNPGKLDALAARFRDHTRAIFDKHGIGTVGFWTAPDESDPTTGAFVYITVFPDEASAQASWASFRQDEDWAAARAATEVDGPLTERIESLFMRPTEFSDVR